MDNHLISKLTKVGTLNSHDRDFQYVSTGSFMLDWVISGKYSGGGIPVPGITQFIGDASTAKSAFATAILADAQKKGYYALFEDAENALTVEFSKALGLDPSLLAYNNPETIESAFLHMEQVIKEIRAQDTETPIIIVLDSLPVLCAEAELADDAEYQNNNMIGAIRAKLTGAALRKFDKIVKTQKVGLVIINQHRSKVGVMFGNPETAAAGGRSLDYYLTVNLRTKKSSSHLTDDKGSVIGIQGSIENKKNKCSIPYRECDYKLLFDKGFDYYYGILPLLEKSGLVTKNRAWYSLADGTKFQQGDFEEGFLTDPKFSILRKEMGLEIENVGE